MSQHDELVIRTIVQKVPLCGCGSTDKMWEIVHDMLRRAEEKGNDRKGFYDAMPEHDLSATAVEFIGHVLGESGVLEHGSSIGWAWLSPAGKTLLAFLDKYPDHDDWPEWTNSCLASEDFTLDQPAWHKLTVFGEGNAKGIP